MRKIVESGEVKSFDEVVQIATLKYLDLHEKGEKYFEIKTGPMINMAVKKGIYKDKREAIEEALKNHEKRLARRMLRTRENSKLLL